MNGKIRVKSQVLELRNISPWVSRQDQSNRNELQVFLNKNSLLEDIKASKQSQSQIKVTSNSQVFETITSQNTKPFYKTCTNFTKLSQSSYNRKFYSQSTCLQKDKYSKLNQQKSMDKIIFVKRSINFRQPKIAKVNMCLDSNLSLTNNTGPVKNDHKTGIRRKRFMLNKQSLGQNVLRDQIIGNKKFINSLKSCLCDFERVSYNQQSNRMLCSTLNNFLNRSKNV